MKKEQKAVALQYDAQINNAPTVIAKGKGRLAEKIIEMAEQKKIHIHHDESLANILLQLDILEEIPSELYQIIAQVFMFIYELDQKNKP